MNNFRALSESRLFIGAGLLFLLLSLLAPVCEAGFASHLERVHAEPTHSEQGSVHQHADSMGMDLSHTDKSTHPCCIDFGAEKSHYTVVVLTASVVVPDTGGVLQAPIPLNRTLFASANIPFVHYFHFNITGLPRYLVTRRLRV